MIPRYQKIILWLLLVSSVLIAAYLIRMRARAQDKLTTVQDAAPMPVPVEAVPVNATLMMANDADGSLAPMHRPLALPAEPTTRARALLNALFANYAKADSAHPLAAVTAVKDVFLLPVPVAATPEIVGTDTSIAQMDVSTVGTDAAVAQMAVINLSGAFVDHHPSGILVETLTLLSVLGTLHANMPQITQVRFVVDGQPRETLAGHTDLTHTYLTANDVPAMVNADDAADAGADGSAAESAPANEGRAQQP